MLLLATLLVSLQLGRSPVDDGDSALESVRRQLADERRPVEGRASLALDEAAALDRLAQSSRDPAERRTRAGQAVALLDEFNAAHPKHSLATPLALQAAVFAWADGRRELDAWRIAPGDESRKSRAIDRLDDAIRRIDRLESDLSGTDPLVAQNARFRLGQALSDRAGLDPARSEAAIGRLRRATAALEPIPVEPSLTGYSRLLRAQILVQLEQFDAAEDELDLAAKAKVPPPADAAIDARADVLIGQRRYSDAIRLVDASGLDAVARAATGLRIRLVQRQNVSAGQARHEVEADAFARAATLRGSPRLDARLALNDLGRSIDVPTSRAEPEDWDILAEAALGLGDPTRAGRLVAGAADKAASRGRAEDAGRLRLRAGAILFQEGDFAGADALLGRVAADPMAGPSRAKAGMLRALAHGRALSLRRPGASRSAYVASLRDQIRDFPADPASVEARWLLAAAEEEGGKPADAVALWKAIPVGHPRWLASRLAVAARNQRDLDELRIANDPQLVRSKYRESLAFLRQGATVADLAADLFELDLATIRLDLTPDVGRPESAKLACDRLARQAGSASQQSRVRALRIAAMVAGGHFVEAEADARAELSRASADDLLLVARLIDHAAAANESEASKGRSGRILRLVVDALARSLPGLPPALQAEAKIREARAAILSGEIDVAKRALRGVNDWEPADLDVDLLRDLADAFLRLEGYGVAVDVERLRARRLKAGSPAWLESRYVQALALDRARKPGDARKILDATAILHPDLGGGELKARYERLRQRIDQE